MTHCYELGKRSIRITPEYDVIGWNYPIKIKTWPSNEIAVGSSSNGTKWSLKFTDKGRN